MKGRPVKSGDDQDAGLARRGLPTSMKGRPRRGGDVDNAWEMTCVQEPR